VEGDPESGLLFLVAQGFSDEDAVALWQSMIAFTVGFSVFSSTLAHSDVFDLPPDLAARMTAWPEDTCTRTLRVILEGYDRKRAARSPSEPANLRSETP
jgi:sulfur transfer complex TusBCD TusB component (DsrH family)